MLICVGLPIVFCCISAFNQPLKESSKFAIGEKLFINSGTRISLDIDFTDATDFVPSSFGIIRHFDRNSLLETIKLLQTTGSKPVIITSMIPKEVEQMAYENTTVGFIDNAVLNNIIFTQFGIITLDNNSTIINKWQKDFLNLQSYSHIDIDKLSVARMTYIIVWIAIFIISIYYLINSIVRGCRKTHQRVGI